MVDWKLGLGRLLRRFDLTRSTDGSRAIHGPRAVPCIASDRGYHKMYKPNVTEVLPWNIVASLSRLSK